MHAATRHRKGFRRQQAFSRTELLMAVVMLIVLVGLLLPGLVPRRRVDGRRIACLNNQKVIGLGFAIFATDNNDRLPWEVPAREGGTAEDANDPARAWRHVSALASGTGNNARIVMCPADPRVAGQYPSNLVFAAGGSNTAEVFSSNQQLSFFLNTGTAWRQRAFLLAGDRCLTLNGARTAGRLRPQSSDRIEFEDPGHHAGQGNLLFADGSVQQVRANGAAKVFADAFLPGGTNSGASLLIP